MSQIIKRAFGDYLDVGNISLSDDYKPYDDILTYGIEKLLIILSNFEKDTHMFKKYDLDKKFYYTFLPFPSFILSKNNIRKILDVIAIMPNTPEINEIKLLLTHSKLVIFGDSPGSSQETPSNLHHYYFEGIFKSIKGNIITVISPNTTILYAYINYAVENSIRNKKNVTWISHCNKLKKGDCVPPKSSVFVDDNYYSYPPFDSTILKTMNDTILIDVIIQSGNLHFEKMNYAYMTILVYVLESLRKLNIGGVLIIYLPYFGKRWVYNLINNVASCFRIHNLNIVDDVSINNIGFGHIYSYAIFDDYKGINDSVIFQLEQAINIFKKCDEGYGTNYNITDKYYKKYGTYKIKKSNAYPNICCKNNADCDEYRDYNKKILPIFNRFVDQINSLIIIFKADGITPKTFHKSVMDNYRYSISVLDKYNSLRGIDVYEWALDSDKYLQTILKNIRLIDIEIYSKKIVDGNDSHPNVDFYSFRRNIIRLNESIYNYVDASNYKLYKNTELYFNNQYKEINKIMDLQYDITINGNYVSRAWLKLYEILDKFGLPGKKVNAFHICEAPGNFVNAAIYYTSKNNIQYDWHAQSLRSKNNKDIFGDSYGFIKKTHNKWDYGEDSTGNIAKHNNFAYYREKYNNIDVLIGDCGAVWSAKSNINLGLFQLIYALTLPRIGGMCILKTHAGNMDKTFIYLLTMMTKNYKEVHIAKSYINFWSSEIYIIGLDMIHKKPLTYFDNLFNNNMKMSTTEKMNNSVLQQYYDISMDIIKNTYTYKVFFTFCSFYPEKFIREQNTIEKYISQLVTKWITKYIDPKYVP
jgi:23S rRNA U2552 (ribose-2'-O)-methylase RlmE/FtsJ